VNASTGAVVQRIDYDEWGQVLQDTNPGFQPFGFAGGLYDRDTGLVRFGARDYDPAVGRWTGKDPLGLEGGLNVYEYAAGDPANNIDPDGQYWLKDLSDFSAAFGSVLSFGLTDVINNATGASSVINKCSGAYSAGKWSGIGLSVAFGVAHLGRNALYQGAERLVSDPRTWGSVRSSWSVAAGEGIPWLRANGVSLHHWLIPQRWGAVNAGFNYLPISAELNSFMNGSTALRSAAEWAFRGTVLGIYGAPATAAAGRGNCGCQ
jgi:RHS repeat-associated protein